MLPLPSAQGIVSVAILLDAPVGVRRYAERSRSTLSVSVPVERHACRTYAQSSVTSSLRHCTCSCVAGIVSHDDLCTLRVDSRIYSNTREGDAEGGLPPYAAPEVLMFPPNSVVALRFAERSSRQMRLEWTNDAGRRIVYELKKTW